MNVTCIILNLLKDISIVNASIFSLCINFWRVFAHTPSSGQVVYIAIGWAYPPVCQDSSLRRIGFDVTWKEQGGCYRNRQLWEGGEIVTTPRVSSDVWNTTSVFPINTKRLLEDTFSSLPAGLNCKEEFSPGNIRRTVNQHNSRYVEIKCQLDATDDICCRFYCLLNMFRAPLCSSSGAREYYTDGCCLWYLVLWFSSCRCGVEMRVMYPVCGLLQHLVGILFPHINDDAWSK